MAQYWNEDKSEVLVAEAYFAREEMIDEIMSESHRRFKEGKKMKTKGVYARKGKTPVTIFEPTTGKTVDMYTCDIVWRYRAYFGHGTFDKYHEYEV